MATEKTDTRSIDERLLAILEAQQQSGQAQLVIAEATAQQLKPKSLSTSQIAQISPFNPRGEKTYKMPRLKCDIYAPWKMEANHHSLTREEVELFNLLEPGEYAFELNDNTQGVMTVIGEKNAATGALERLRLSPEPMWNNEHKGKFKSMAETLRFMLGGCTGVLTMKEEKAQIARGELAVSVHG